LAVGTQGNLRMWIIQHRAGRRAAGSEVVGKAERMAYFMIPRYVRILPELPKTPSAKVLKAELRREGITADTWDRERAGIVIRRDRIGS
jgi:acyl-CoA synthetase (AMP-forming)/AMP-acid ligase II